MVGDPVSVRQSTNDTAVSAVIAVILMVAITVILAALVASIVMGMTTNIPKTKVVTVTASQPEADIIVVTYYGGQDQHTCTGIRWDVTDSNGFQHPPVPMGDISPSAASILSVGTELQFTGNFLQKDHLVATAYFTDGTQQVILDVFI